MHFSWFDLVPFLSKHPNHILTASFGTILIAIISLIAKAAAGKPEEALVPHHKISIRGFFEVVVEGISGLVESVMGPHNEKLIPLIGSSFLFVLINNVVGLFPGFNSSTQNINTALACGIFIFFFYNFMGVKASGAKYFTHFFGPQLGITNKALNVIIFIVFNAMFMLPIELISHVVRPMSMGLRLSGNMTGDHTVLGIFLNLVPIGVPMVFYLLGMFVCFVQAFVFTLLSMVYISLATAHDH